MTTHWTSNATCRDHEDPDLWFPSSYIGGPANRQLHEARAECLSCPVRQACLDEAMRKERGLSADGRHGVVGGLTPAERFALDAPNQGTRPRCGTLSAYRAHRSASENPCAPCKDAYEVHVERMQAAGRWSPCGTDGAYQRHLRHDETPCGACRDAHQLKRKTDRATVAA